jgi:uncharacterized protein
MLEQKLDKLLSLLREMQTAAICFSGGTDSTFLAWAANKVLSPEKFILFHVCSDMIPRAETAFAREWTELHKLPIEFVKLDPLNEENVVRNDFDRCYYCKKIITRAIAEAAKSRGLAYVLDGLNCDDLDDYRPGTKAADEIGVRHPLLEAGLNKSDIRVLSERWKLPNWNTPPSACLASRLPYGMKITVERLRMIDEGEEFLRHLGYHGCRVRCLEDGARIELQPEDLISAAQNAELIVDKLRRIGVKRVMLDLGGYVRGGGCNPE